MAPEVISDAKWERIWRLAEQLVLRNRPAPLSPLWERWIVEFTLPAHRSYPARAAAGEADEVGQEKRAMYQRSCALGPFDFTDTWVSTHRARNFRDFLDDVRETLAGYGYVRKRWWPVSRLEMIETIKAERERLGRQVAGVAGGVNGGGSSSGSGSSGGSGSSSIKKEPHDAAPATSGTQNDLVKAPSNNKRKAEDTVITSATTEPPTASSVEGSGSKIKRERTA